MSTTGVGQFFIWLEILVAHLERYKQCHVNLGVLTKMNGIRLFLHHDTADADYIFSAICMVMS